MGLIPPALVISRKLLQSMGPLRHRAQDRDSTLDKEHLGGNSASLREMKSIQRNRAREAKQQTVLLTLSPSGEFNHCPYQIIPFLTSAHLHGVSVTYN